jgi:hypothetical protein
MGAPFSSWLRTDGRQPESAKREPRGIGCHQAVTAARAHPHEAACDSFRSSTSTSLTVAIAVIADPDVLRQSLPSVADDETREIKDLMRCLFLTLPDVLSNQVASERKHGYSIRFY